jgi:hypothetical protein
MSCLTYLDVTSIDGIINVKGQVSSKDTEILMSKYLKLKT